MAVLPAVGVAMMLASTPVDRTIAVTLDDLPWVGGPDEAAAAKAATGRLLAALAAHEAQATVFVTGGRIAIDGDAAVGAALLQRWREAGHALENHSWSHLQFSDTPVDVYLDDVQRGRDALAGVRFYRAPFNDVGGDALRRDALLASLQLHDERLAPFTIEHSDYVFNSLFVDALARDDVQQATRIGDAYLAQLDVALDFAEALAAETFDRDIPQVLLIHANAINARYLGTMLDRLAARGYRFVGLEEAMDDPAYALPVGEPMRWGWSWLHRWRKGLGLENRMRDEPDPPQWVMDAASALQGGG